MTEIQISSTDMRLTLVFLFVGIGLTACSGGGSTSAMMPVPFTSFSAIKTNEPVQANGISQTVTASTFPPTGAVTATTVNAVDTANSSATLTYGPLPAINSFSLSTPGSSVSYSGLNVLCTGGTGICTGSVGNSQAVVLNPLDPPAPTSTFAWNYQSFGYWLVTPSNTTRIAGAMSFGSPTPPASVPGIATADGTYKGASGGIYIDPSGNIFTHAATMTSTVHFSTRTIDFSTTTTALTAVTPLAIPPALSTLDLIGSFTYVGGSNQFAGSITPPTAFPLTSTGTAKGQFYGPTAQELGGVFSLKAPSGPQTMLGGFGGVKQ